MAASFLVDSESLTDVLIAIGAIGLFPGVVLVHRGRASCDASRSGTSAARGWLDRSIVRRCCVASAAVLVGADVYGAVPLFGDGTDTWHWGATLAMLFAEGIGLFAAVTGAVVVVLLRRPRSAPAAWAHADGVGDAYSTSESFPAHIRGNPTPTGGGPSRRRVGSPCTSELLRWRRWSRRTDSRC